MPRACLILWTHLCSLEAMYQDELGEFLRTQAPGSLICLDESWWRWRWLQESKIIA